jgi:hypothetical protein
MRQRLSSDAEGWSAKLDKKLSVFQGTRILSIVSVQQMLWMSRSSKSSMTPAGIDLSEYYQML